MAAIARRALRAATRLAAEPPAIGRLSGERVFLAAAVVVQWAAVAALAVSVPHNGWFYFQGGDETFFYTIAWIVAHGHIPVTGIGYVWSLVEAPIAAIAGPNVLVALPAIVAVQVLVLLPLALVAFYGLTKRLLGAAVARLGVVVWVAAPFAVIPLFVGRYHVRWVEQTLPQLLGLTGMGDFASMVALLCAAYLVFRHLDEGDLETAVFAGLVTGLGIGLKPSTAVYLAGPAVAFLVARRWRGSVAYAAGMAPALLTLALWKYRGLGTLPAFSSSMAGTELAAGAHYGAGLVGTSGIHKYVDVNWHHLGQNLDAIREYFWSVRLVEWLPVAGAIGAARASRPKAAFLVAWLAAYVLVKGTSEVSSVDTASFWRLLSPAWPAYVLLGLSVTALVPTLGARVRAAPVAPVVRRSRHRLAAAVLVLAIVPLVVVAALPADKQTRSVYDRERNLYLPVDPSFRLHATSANGEVTLTWDAPSSGSTTPTFLVRRVSTAGPLPTGLGCDLAPVPRCVLVMDDLGFHTAPFHDRPGPGRWLYRVALAASYTSTPGEGDTLVYSLPATVTVGR